MFGGQTSQEESGGAMGRDPVPGVVGGRLTLSAPSSWGGCSAHNALPYSEGGCRSPFQRTTVWDRRSGVRKGALSYTRGSLYPKCFHAGHRSLDIKRLLGMLLRITTITATLSTIDFTTILEQELGCRPSPIDDPIFYLSNPSIRPNPTRALGPRMRGEMGPMGP